MLDESVTLKQLKEEVARFVHERSWEHYHNLKDLAIALSVEASELLNLFKWKRVEELNVDMESIEDELADVVIYALCIANVLETDLSNAILKKLEKNRAKYPIGSRLG
ncbi:MAG: nucleotide pyrophosphohydrolase [Candidatus Methanomethylicota archaeon]|uniref:Nucleotide pyrophosphohydrolase n=1 Tax=Thermoproteota archaeon TaxID=2056631 RepID=A0A497F471_9CREN|nr:MAG: nucleotide pyrophosphohydrolase [Candidatus Verstraetearchaeota archaeon]